MYDFTNVDPVKCCAWLVLPTVYDESLSYGEQLNKFCKALNELIENNNNLPDYVAEMIQNYITSGAIDEVVRNILANYILNVKYPPKGISPAVGDGSADDTDAIQGCIDYAFNKGGGCVYFPYGKYLSRSLTLRSGVSLVGFDRYSTRIVQRGGDTKPLVSGENVQNVQISNLSLDGNNEVQTDDLDVVNILGKDCLFTNLVIKSGFQCFVYNGLGGNLQVDNVVFGGAVKKVAVINGKGSVQFTNVKFNELGKILGECVLEVEASDGDYRFSSKAISPLCIRVSGSRNTFNCDIINSTSNFTDSGMLNNFNIFGVEVKKQLTGQKSYTGGSISENITGNKSVVASGDLSENISGNVSENISGDASENISGDKILIIGKSKSETITENKTENITGNREIDIGGADSIHVDGVSAVNIGGARTEAYGSSLDINVKGVYTAEYEQNVTKTYRSNRILNTIDNTVNATSYVINFLKHTLDLRLVTNSITSVKVYGAKGDGVTNDTQAIQDALNSDYGIIIFDSGVYLTNTIHVPSNKILIGKNACINVNSGNTCLFINKSDGSIGEDKANTNITFYGLELNGVNAENCSLITMGHCNNIRILNCYLHDCKGYHSIAFNSCSQCYVDNCTITEYGGASSTTESIQLDICDDSSSFQWFGPYDSYPTQNIKISNCTIIGKPNLLSNSGGYCGIGNHLLADKTKINRISINNCTIKSFSRGISFMCGSAIKINNCFITGCNAGIYAEKIDNSTITGNTLTGIIYPTANTYYIGIHIVNTENILVDANFIREFGKTGILVEGIGNKISNNHCRLNYQFGIRIGMNDQATLYDGNFCFNNGLNVPSGTLGTDLMVRIEKTSGDYFGSVTITNNKATTFYNDLPSRETEPQNSQFCFNIIKNSVDIKDSTLKANYNIVNSVPVN